MRLQSHANKLVTNVQAETQNFGIGDASVVIEILRNRLYEHKVRTLVQEYMCNARDAMREVGNNNPIEVTLPTRFNPTFKVRDFGPGITPERMQNVFVMYGSSTKRKDNSQTGGFGIGAKSAWSYTDSFTIVTYIDGTKRTYVAHTGVNNNGRLDLISTDNTTDKNGTEIQIAVKQVDINDFVDSAFRASYFWDVQPTFKGTAEKPEREVGLTFVKNLEITRGNLPDFLQLRGDSWHSAKIGLVIDGVPYKVSETLLQKCKALVELNSLVGSFALISLPNGFVEVSASREAVADSTGTIKNLDTVASEMCKSLKNHVKGEFAKVKEVSEFLTVYKSFQFYLNMGTFQCNFKGYTVAGDNIKSDIFQKVQLTRYDYKRAYRRNGGQTPKLRTKENADAIGFKELNHVYVVKADDSLIMRNRRIRETLNSGVESIVILSPLPGDTFANFDKVKSDLKIGELNTELPQIAKLPKAKVKREDAEFCMHTYDGGRHTYTTLASNTIQWLYLPIDHKFEASQLRDLQHHGLNVCTLGERALKMIQKDKNFTLLTDWIASYKPNAKELARAKYKAAENRDHIETLQKAAKHGLKDTMLKTMLKEYESFLNHSDSIESGIIEGIIKNSKEFKDFVTADKALSRLIKDKYSLVTDLSGYSQHAAEIAFYLNAKHAE